MAASGTILGLPAGLIIAGLGNIPNLAVDAYQFGRDLHRGDYGGSVENGLETALDVASFGTAKTAYKAEKQAKALLRRRQTLAGKAPTMAERKRLLREAQEKYEHTVNPRKRIAYTLSGMNDMVNVNHAKDVFINPLDNSNIKPKVVLRNDNTRNEPKVIYINR